MDFEAGVFLLGMSEEIGHDGIVVRHIFTKRYSDGLAFAVMRQTIGRHAALERLHRPQQRQPHPPRAHHVILHCHSLTLVMPTTQAPLATRNEPDRSERELTLRRYGGD